MEPARVHLTLLGTSPSEEQRKLYDGFPSYRGYSASSPTDDHFEATFVAALTQALGAGGKFNRSYIFVPATKVEWVNSRTIQIAQTMFGLLKLKPSGEQRRKTCENLGAVLKHLLVGSRVLQMEDEPARWVALGFQSADPIPEWMRNALLPV